MGYDPAIWNKNALLKRPAACQGSPFPVASLTADELAAMDTMSKFAGQMHRLCGDGPQSASDWREAAAHIHVLQTTIMAQAASRAYPELFRPLGGNGDCGDIHS